MLGGWSPCKDILSQILSCSPPSQLFYSLMWAREFKSCVNIYRHHRFISQLTLRYGIYYCPSWNKDRSYSTLTYSLTNNRKPGARESKQHNLENFLKENKNKKGCPTELTGRNATRLQEQKRTWCWAVRNQWHYLWSLLCCLLLLPEMTVLFSSLIISSFSAIHSTWLKGDVLGLYRFYISYIWKINESELKFPSPNSKFLKDRMWLTQL